MNKKLFYVIVAAFIIFCKPSFAQLKTDGSALGSRVFSSVETFVESTVKKVNAAAKKVTESKLGQSVKTKYETFQSLRTRIQADVKSGKKMYDDASKTYAEGKTLYNKSRQTYEEQMAALKNSQATSSVTLQKELDGIDAQLAARQNAVQQELNARLKDAEQNQQILQAMYEAEEYEDTKDSLQQQLADTKDLIKQYREALNNADDGQNKYLNQDSEYQRLLQQKQETKQKLNTAKAAIATTAVGLGAAIVAKMVKKSKEEKKAAYQEGIDQNYIAPDEVMDQVTVNRVRKERRENFKKDIANAFVHLVGVRQRLAAFEEQKDDLVNNIESVDYAVTALALQNEQLVQKTNLLIDELNLDVAMHRLETSYDMLNRDFRFQNPDKNAAEIDMDSYQVTEKDIEKAGISK